MVCFCIYITPTKKYIPSKEKKQVHLQKNVKFQKRNENQQEFILIEKDCFLQLITYIVLIDI